jgi:uncharacterized protein (DUF488 family)
MWMSSSPIYTVGHSTRSLDELIALLAGAGVRQLVDVRSVPRSRRHPHFAGGQLARSLPEHAIAYAHEPGLGGFRRPRTDSANRGWEQAAFRGYADHMATGEFASALQRLEALARERSTCVMCAEAQWWRCHRRLLADALVASGRHVLHLGLGSGPTAHELTTFAVVQEGRVLYPPVQGELALGTTGASAS